ncbi:MAG: FKBP-type peptidyl-prolyl cis-trans isomerase [Bacteroidales bacterium]|nr:FKBP-type peptidyl-prolyl cis-trans isomerase [Bacteroidales bacterium]
MTQEEKISYALGVAIGSNYAKMNLKIDAKSFTDGVVTVMEGKQPCMSMQEIQQVLDELQNNLESKGKAMIEAEKEKGRQFLEANRQKAGVKETASGLQYKVLVESIGKKPAATDTVEVHYEGRLIDGTVFDSSFKRGETISFPLNRVIAGWTEGLQLMSEGSKFEFYIPSHLAYGDHGAGEAIPGGATLIFQVELFKVK